MIYFCLIHVKDSEKNVTIFIECYLLYISNEIEKYSQGKKWIKLQGQFFFKAYFPSQVFELGKKNLWGF